MPDQSPNNGAGYAGTQQPDSFLSEYAVLSFIIQSMLNKLATATIVKVMAVTNNGGVVPPGFVDIKPMVNQTDGAGNAFEHGTIYRCPYYRSQGGGNAIILDPQVGDLGIAVFASSDISSVAANKGQANPGSRRRFDWADAMYFGGLLNQTAILQWIAFSPAGIDIHSPNLIHLFAPNLFAQNTTVIVQASTSVEIETPTFDVDATTAEINASGTATLAGATTNVTGAATTIGGTATLNLVSPSLEYNGTPFDPTAGVSNLPNPPPSDSPSMVTGDVVFEAPSDTSVILKRRGSDGNVYGIQFDLALIP